LLPLYIQTFLYLITILLVDFKYFLLSDDDDPKNDAAAASLFDTLTVSKEPSQEEVVVVKSSIVPPAKSTLARPTKHLKKVATVSTSLEVHRPGASSDNVSSASCTRFFSLLYLFSHTFVLQTLMQKFLSLGVECVGFQETAQASQGMSVLCCSSLFFLCLPMIAYCLSFSFDFVVTLTAANARILALEAKLNAAREAWEVSNAAKVSAEKIAKSAETKAKKAKKSPHRC
jgi:hypothetical protein